MSLGVAMLQTQKTERRERSNEQVGRIAIVEKRMDVSVDAERGDETGH